jgi:transcriptional regulator with XRE-family HTH domain
LNRAARPDDDRRVRPDLAATIVEARRTAGLSQAALARRAGISASYLSRIEGAAWERGGPLPADGVLRALARALGLSSAALVALGRAARDRQAAASGSTGAPARASRRSPYAVSMGPEAVDAAAREVVERNPPQGTLRSAQVFVTETLGDGGLEPSYLDTLGTTLAASPDAMLYRVCASDRSSLDTARATVDRLSGGRPPGRAGNVRTRIAFSNPLVLDVLIGDHEVMLAVPDRRGRPHLRAGIVVDDPDFVAALRNWFDETVWDPKCWYADLRGDAFDDAFAAIEEVLSGAEQHLDPAAPLVVGPGADAHQLERPGQDVPAVTG